MIQTIPDSPADCQAKGGTWISKDTTEKPFLGLGATKVIATEYCDLNKTNWTKIIIVAVIILALIFLFKPALTIIKRVFRL